MSRSVRCDGVMHELKARADAGNVVGMARFGISTKGTLGVSIAELRPLARLIGVDHQLALELWETGIHEARILAAFIDDPALVSEAQMEAWAADLDSWDVCDQVCSRLFDRTPHAWRKAVGWSARQEEFVKRSGFVLMAALSVHDKIAADERFLALLPIIEREAGDDRPYVKKAVNWALRQIGKRDVALSAAAVAAAERIREQGSRSARWIASDALRELNSDKVRRRLEMAGGVG